MSYVCNRVYHGLNQLIYTIVFGCIQSCCGYVCCWSAHVCLVFNVSCLFTSPIHHSSNTQMYTTSTKTCVYRQNPRDGKIERLFQSSHT